MSELHPQAPAGAPGGTGGQWVIKDSKREASGQLDVASAPEPWDEERRQEAAEEINELVQQAVEDFLVEKKYRPMNGGPGSMGHYESQEIYVGRNARGDRVFVQMHMEHVDKPSKTIDLVDSSQHWDVSYTSHVIEKGHRDWSYGGAGVVDEKMPNIHQRRDLDRLRELSDEWHLSGTNAGSRNQKAQADAIIADCKARPGQDVTKRLLDEVEPDGDYRYGSAWLSKDVEPEVIEESFDILRRMKERKKS